MSKFQTYYHFKLALKKVDQHSGGKWSIDGTKRRKVYHGYAMREVSVKSTYLYETN